MTRPAALLAVLLAAAPATAQPADVFGGGSDAFRALLHVAGVRPISLVEFQATPRSEREDVIVVLRGGRGLGGPDSEARLWPPNDRLGWVKATVDGGGAVLVLGDRPAQFGALGWPGTGVGERRVLPGPDGTGPFAVPLRTPQPGPLRELFRDLHRVATRTPAAVHLSAPPADLVPLAGFPPGAVFDDGARLAPTDVLAAGREWAGGARFLVVADPSVVSNDALAREDADNLALALRVVAFLRDGRRTRCFFYEPRRSGDPNAAEPFDSLFRAAEPPPPLPNVPNLLNKLADAGNRAIDQAQQSDALTRGLLGNTNERQARSMARLLPAVAAAAAALAALYVLRRVWGTRFRAAGVPPPHPPGRPPAPDPDGVFDRRQQELLRRNNLAGPARDLVRGLMAEAGAPPLAGDVVPPLHFAGDPRYAARLRQVIGELWAVGYGPPKPVGVKRWRELEPKLDLARRAFENGAWRFAAGSSSA